MRILGAGFVRRYEGRLLNIHPSLLPAFTGLHTHRRAIEAGCKVAGATVHFVTPELDHGPIIAQAVVPVLPGDSEDALAARVLATRAPHLPAAVRWFVSGAAAHRAAAWCGTPTAHRSCCCRSRCRNRRRRCIQKRCWSAAELLRAVLTFEQPADAVVSALLPRAARARRARAPRAGRDGLRGAAPAAAVPAPGAFAAAGAMERRLALLGWQGNARFLQAALDEDEQAWLARSPASTAPTLPDKLRHNLPDWLAGALQAAARATSSGRWSKRLDAPAPLDLRVNALKAKRDEVLARAARAPASRPQPTPYSPLGLARRGQAGAAASSTLFAHGAVEVQDEGSQLLALLLDAKRGEMVVDFCAGAGGKTLALGAAMRNTGRLYAFDISGHRLDALKPRLARSGLSNVHPAQIAHERDDRIKRLAGKIDRVLVDAPCSGPGHAAPQPGPEVAPVAAVGGRN